MSGLMLTLLIRLHLEQIAQVLIFSCTHPLASLHPDDEKLLEDDDPNAINDRRLVFSPYTDVPIDLDISAQLHGCAKRNTFPLNTTINGINQRKSRQSLFFFSPFSILRLGHNIKQRFAEEIVYRDRESQINAIEATFTAAKKPIQRHYSKPGVHAVEVLPLLPDFKLWRYPCAQVIQLISQSFCCFFIYFGCFLYL